MGQFISSDAARERLSSLLDRVEAAYREMGEMPCDAVGNHYRVQMAERLETQERLNRAMMYRVFGQIADPPDEAGMVPAIKQRLSSRLRIPVREVSRRLAVAARICPRRQLTGPPLPAQLPAVADAVASGVLGEDHLKQIIAVIDRLPSCTSPADRVDVEASLVRESSKHAADFVAELGKGIDAVFNPDGHFDEQDRARRRGLTMGRQGVDGMSKLSGYVDPETRSYIEAVAAAVRPGRHLPTAPSSRPATIAIPPSAATTASNSGSRLRSDPAKWVRTVDIRSPWSCARRSRS